MECTRVTSSSGLGGEDGVVGPMVRKNAVEIGREDFSEGGSVPAYVQLRDASLHKNMSLLSQTGWLLRNSS